MRGMWRMLRSHHLRLIQHTGENLHVGGYYKCGVASHHTYSRDSSYSSFIHYILAIISS
jgi:hypothetical protein